MSSTVNRFAVVYRVRGGAEHCIAKGSSKETAYIAIGRVIDKAHAERKVLDYVRVVPCRKRPGTKVIFEMSRTVMDQQKLVALCNYFHRKAVAQQ